VGEGKSISLNKGPPRVYLTSGMRGGGDSRAVEERDQKANGKRTSRHGKKRVRVYQRNEKRMPECNAKMRGAAVRRAIKRVHRNRGNRVLIRKIFPTLTRGDLHQSPLVGGGRGRKVMMQIGRTLGGASWTQPLRLGGGEYDTGGGLVLNTQYSEARMRHGAIYKKKKLGGPFPGRLAARGGKGEFEKNGDYQENARGKKRSWSGCTGEKGGEKEVGAHRFVGGGKKILEVPKTAGGEVRSVNDLDGKGGLRIQPRKLKAQ